jgi:hypothetical protein
MKRQRRKLNRPLKPLRLRIKFPILSKDLKWLAPYLDTLRDFVPIEKIYEIKMVKFRDKFPDHEAIIENLGRKGFKIILRPYEPAFRRLPISKLDQDTMIQNLSHEISHILVWEEHDPDRVIAQAKILTRFADKLKELGYEKDRNKV